MYCTRTSKATRVFFSIVILLSLCPRECALSAETHEAADNAFELRVMSFNIRYGSAGDGQNHWPNRRELVFDVIRRQKSDVVGLQEALVNAIRHGNGEDPEVPVIFEVNLEKSRLVMTITDRGPGVDLDEVPDPTSPENLLRASGRGFLFIQKAMDQVRGEKQDQGFTLIMEKQIG